MQFPKSKDADYIQTFSLARILCVENKYAYWKETRIFRILYLSFRRSSRKSYASYACSHFWMSLDLPVCITFVLSWRFIYLFFKHLPKCFSVTVKLLYCTLKAVCSTAELIVLTYFYCVPAYSKRIECYHCRAGRGLQFGWSPYTSSFFTTYVFDSYCTFHGQIQEIHLTKSLFPFSHRPY